MIIDSLRRACSTALRAIITHGQSAEPLTVKGGLAFYYKALPIPILLILVITGIDFILARAGVTAATFWSPSLTDTTGPGSSGAPTMPLYPIMYLLTYPLFGLLNAAIFHGAGRLFRLWNGGFARTFAAVINGLLPVAFFLWVLSIPLLTFPIAAITNLVFLASYIWNAITTITALKTLHGIPAWRALTGFLVGTLLIFFTMTFYYNFNITMTITRDTFRALFG